MEIIKLFSWFLVIFGRIWMDRNGRKYSTYLPVWIALGALSIAHGALMDIEYREDYFGGGYIPWTFFPLVIWQMCSYWIFFELGINICMERMLQLGVWKGLLYFDQKEGDSGNIDRFFAKHPKLHTPAKIVVFIIFVLLTLYYI